MPTIKDVARLANTSTATVSRYLNGEIVKEKNRNSIVKAIQGLNYSINPAAKSLKTNKTYTIGFIVPHLLNSFFSEIAESVQKFLFPHKFSVIFLSFDNELHKLNDVIRFLIDKNVDGIMICMISGITPDHLLDLKKKKIPLVLIDNLLQGSDEIAVLIDNVNGSYQAVEHFIQNGHTRIGIINGPQTTVTGLERYLGYLRALEDYSIAPQDRLIKFGDYSTKSGEILMGELLASDVPPSAVLVCNYRMTVGALKAINEAKIRIPEDLSYITFDDTDISRIYNTPLTSVRQPLKLIGETASRILLDKMHGMGGDSASLAAVHRLKTDLVVRQSVAKK